MGRLLELGDAGLQRGDLLGPAEDALLELIAFGAQGGGLAVSA